MTTRKARPTLARVADVYRKASDDGMPPTKAVREAFSVSQSTAGAWVANARAAGLLPGAAAGQRSARNAKAVRVAKELGVEYAALVRAVKKHAGGDLRL